MMDMGLARGVQFLWVDDLLCDYTIKVEEREFRVHKVVLASVSEYFKVMLTGSMKESQTDRVELKELSADTFFKLLDLIYTGNEDIVDKNAREVFPCAVYLDVPAAIQACKEKIVNDINVSNCLETLSLVLTYGNPRDAIPVRHFINRNWEAVQEKFNPKDLTYEMLKAITDIWRGSEWELFQLVRDWIDEDSKNRAKSSNNLMNRIRFSLMTPQEVTAVKKTPMYKKSKDTWRELVDKAVIYHKLPIHSKVLENSEQSTLRGQPQVTFFSQNSYKGSKTCVTLNSSKEQWETDNVKGPKFSNVVGCTIQVNNFLIFYTDLDKGQTDWYIFDPRSLKWSEMASMCRPKAGFGLVHYKQHLYVIGGRLEDKKPTKSVEQYDFKTDTWKSARNCMPVPVANILACVLDDSIYCFGGYCQMEGVNIRSNRMDCLNMCTQKWERKTPMDAPEYNRSEVSVMTISGEKVIIFARKSRVDTYNPKTDQWSLWSTMTMVFRELTWDHMSSIMTEGDTMYLLNVLETMEDNQSDSSSDSDDIVHYRRVCLRWRMNEELNLPAKATFDDLPVPEEMFGGVLTLPDYKMKLKKWPGAWGITLY